MRPPIAQFGGAIEIRHETREVLESAPEAIHLREVFFEANRLANVNAPVPRKRDTRVAAIASRNERFTPSSTVDVSIPCIAHSQEDAPNREST